MTPTQFVSIAEVAFRPFMTDLGFVMTPPRISGRSYAVDFERADHVVSVSFEPGDDYLLVFVSPEHERSLAALDDAKKSPRLSDLCARYMPQVTQADRNKVERLLASVDATEPDELRMVDAARRIALVLPLYLQDRGSK